MVCAYFSVLLALDPTTTPAGAVRQAETDWKRDSEGTLGLDQTRFYWTWFELADLYTTSIDADEYVAFLSRMLTAIVREDKATGMIMWQEDRKIIEECAHTPRAPCVHAPLPDSHRLSCTLSLPDAPPLCVQPF